MLDLKRKWVNILKETLFFLSITCVLTFYSLFDIMLLAFHCSDILFHERTFGVKFEIILVI